MKDETRLSIKIAGEKPIEFTGSDLKRATDRLEREEESRVARAKGMKPDLPVMAEADKLNDVGGVSGQRLKTYLDRIERLEEEKSGLADDIKDIYAEAKAFGYDVKTLRTIVRLRKIDENTRREADELLELYKSTIGME